MADEEKHEQTEEQAPEVQDAGSDPEPEAPSEDAPAEEAPSEEPSAGSDPEPEAPSEPADDEGSDPPSEPAAEAPSAAEAEGDEEAPLAPKQLRKRRRSTHTGEAKPQRAPEERAAERAESRTKATANRRRYRQRTRGRRGEPGQGTSPAERAPGPKKVRLGEVVSTKADKTITVRIQVARRHPTYEKVVRRSATVHAHDADNQAQEGDTVRVIETRPLSRTKRWRLLEIVERAR
jgi:small subunit ribosomal protein S17